MIISNRFWNIFHFVCDIREREETFKSRNCSLEKSILLSIKITTHYNHSLNQVIFVISVSEHPIERKEHFRCRIINNKSWYKDHSNHTQKKRLNLKNTEIIAFLEYNCCGNVKSERNTNTFQVEDCKHYRPQNASIFDDKPIFEDIT